MTTHTRVTISADGGPTTRQCAAGIAICIVLLAAMFYVANLSDSGRLFGFDGTIFEPGCDLGNPNCEPEDLAASCRYVGPRDAGWRYCTKGDSK